MNKLFSSKCAGAGARLSMRDGFIRRFILVLVVGVGAGFSPVANAQETGGRRTFTNDEGRKIEAKVIGIKGRTVELRKDPTEDKTYFVPIAKLSPDDRAYLKQWFKDNGLYDLRFSERAVQTILDRPNPKSPSENPPGMSYRSLALDVKMSWDRGLYEIEIQNNALLELKGATLDYRVQILRTDLADRFGRKHDTLTSPAIFKGSISIPNLPIGKTVKVETAPIDLFHRRWIEKFTTSYSSNGTTHYTTNLSKFRIRHELDGVDLKVKIGERVVATYQTEDRRVKPIPWRQAPAYSKNDFKIREKED